MSHEIQFSNYGTRTDYRRDGGQDVLFLFSRLSVLLPILERHSVTLLYQPLKLETETETVARRNLVVDDQTFAAGTNLRYLGGGAEGTSDDEGPGDGFNSNWLHFAALSLGERLQQL